MKISAEDIEGELDTSVSYSFSSNSSNQTNEPTHPLQSNFEHFLQTYYSNSNSILNSSDDSDSKSSKQCQDNLIEVDNVSFDEIITFFKKKDDEVICGHIEGIPVLCIENDKDLLAGLTLAQKMNKSLKFSIQSIAEFEKKKTKHEKKHLKRAHILDGRLSELKSEMMEIIEATVKTQIEFAKTELRNEFLLQIENQQIKHQEADSVKSSEESSHSLSDGTQTNYHSAFCDICEGVILNIRYKCINCADFDLCEQCEAIENVHNPSHIFLKIKNPIKKCIRFAIIDESKIDKMVENESPAEVDVPIPAPSKGKICCRFPKNFNLQAFYDGKHILFDNSMSLVTCPVIRGKKGNVISIKFLLSNEDSYEWSGVKYSLVYSSMPELIIKRPRISRRRDQIFPKTTRSFDLRLKVPNNDNKVFESTWRLFCDDKVFGPLIVFRVASVDNLLKDTNQLNNLAQNYVPQVFDFLSHVSCNKPDMPEPELPKDISFASKNSLNKGNVSKFGHNKLLRKRSRLFLSNTTTLAKEFSNRENAATGAVDCQLDSSACEPVSRSLNLFTDLEKTDGQSSLELPKSKAVSDSCDMLIAPPKMNSEPLQKQSDLQSASDLCDFSVASEKVDAESLEKSYFSFPQKSKKTSSASEQKASLKSESDDFVESTIKVTADVFSFAINTGKAAVRLFSEDIQKFNKNTHDRISEAFESNVPAEKKPSSSSEQLLSNFQKMPLFQTVPFSAANWELPKKATISKPTQPEATSTRASISSEHSLDKPIDHSDDAAEKDSNVAMLGSALSELSIDRECESSEDAAEKASNVALAGSTLSAISVDKKEEHSNDYLSCKINDSIDLSSQSNRLVNSPVPSQISEGSSYEMVMSDDFDFEADENRLILSTYEQLSLPPVSAIEEESNDGAMNNSTRSMYSSLNETFEKASFVDKSEGESSEAIVTQTVSQSKIAEINVQQLNLANPTDEEKILVFLKESGFNDLSKNKELIKKHDGKINFIINDLLEL